MHVCFNQNVCIVQNKIDKMGLKSVCILLIKFNHNDGHDKSCENGHVIEFILSNYCVGLAKIPNWNGIFVQFFFHFIFQSKMFPLKISYPLITTIYYQQLLFLVRDLFWIFGMESYVWTEKCLKLIWNGISLSHLGRSDIICANRPDKKRRI